MDRVQQGSVEGKVEVVKEVTGYEGQAGVLEVGALEGPKRGAHIQVGVEGEGEARSGEGKGEVSNVVTVWEVVSESVGIERDIDRGNTRLDGGERDGFEFNGGGAYGSSR